MFDEEINLGEWEDSDGFIREVVNVVPWSSGPMIFTALVRTKEKAVVEKFEVSEDPADYPGPDRFTKKPTDAVMIEDSLWKFDPNVKGEVDYVAGTYNV
jgi:hypothetical protein